MARDEVVALLLGDALPPARLGELLRKARHAHGWKRKHVAAMLRVRPKQLRAYERGEESVPPEVRDQLAEIYGDELLARIPDRVPVKIDTARAAAEPDAYLVTYLELVQRLRKTKPGEPVPLRATDLTALSAALERDPDVIECQIADALGCSRQEARSIYRELLRHRVVLPVAGLAASVVALSGAHTALASAATPVPVAPPAVHAQAAPQAVHHTHKATPPTTVAPTTTVAPAPPAPTPAPPETHVSAPEPQPVPAPAITPPSIPPDDTPVGVLPGEHPLPPPTP